MQSLAGLRGLAQNEQGSKNSNRNRAGGLCVVYSFAFCKFGQWHIQFGRTSPGAPRRFCDNANSSRVLQRAFFCPGQPEAARLSSLDKFRAILGDRRTDNE